MSNAYIENKLRDLTPKERMVLYWRCKGLNQTAIGEEIGVKKDMVKKYMTKIFATLLINTKGMHDWYEAEQVLQENYCKRVIEIIENKEDLGLPSGEIDLSVPPEWAIQLVVQQSISEGDEEEVEKGEEIKKEQGKEEEEPVIVIPVETKGSFNSAQMPPKLPPGQTPPPPRRPWWLLILLVIGVIAAYFLGRKSIEATPAITPTPYPTYTFQPTLAPVVIVETSTPLSFSPTPIPPIFTPTSPVTPTLPSPTATLSPLAKIMSPEWKQDPISGNYIINNGSITSQGQKSVIFTIGDESWKNYDIQISFSGFNADGCDFYLGVRAKDKNNMVGLKGDRAGRLSWWTVTDGVWTGLFQTESLYPFAPMVLEVTVNGDDYNWLGHSDTVISGYDQGGIVLDFGCMGIDKVVITMLP